MCVRSLGQEDFWRRAWQSTLVFLPVESHGQRNLADHSPQVAKSWTRLMRLSMHAKYGLSWISQGKSAVLPKHRITD